jgi:hypothetical protein
MVIDNSTQIFGEFDTKIREIIEPQIEWISVKTITKPKNGC